MFSKHAKIQAALKAVKSATINAKRDFKDFKEEVAIEKQKEMIKKPCQVLLELLRVEMHVAELARGQVKGEIYYFGDSKPLETEIKTLQRDMQYHEKRIYLRSLDPKQRKTFIDTCWDNDPEFIKAIIQASYGIVEDGAIEGMRRKLAFTSEPILETREKAADEKYKAIRKGCGEVNGEAVEFLCAEGVEDPISKKEFHEVFPAKNSHEAYFINKAIRKEESEKAIEAARKEWEERNQKDFLKPDLRNVPR